MKYGVHQQIYGSILVEWIMHPFLSSPIHLNPNLSKSSPNHLNPNLSISVQTCPNPNLSFHKKKYHGLSYCGTRSKNLLCLKFRLQS